MVRKGYYLMQNYRGRMNQNTRCGNYEYNSRTGCENTKVSTPCSMSKEYVLAMAYVPWQKWENIYCSDKALKRGTIFADLDKPFYGRGGCNS